VQRGPSGTADVGQADPHVTAALTAWAQGQLPERGLLAALAASRVLIPVVAVPMKGDGEPEKQTDMALPKLVGKDGRSAVMAFTSVDTMKGWDPSARPVPVPVPRACEAAISEDSALVLDVAGPVPLSVDGARLEAIASGDPIPPPHLDQDVQAVVASLAPGAALVPAERGDLIVELTPVQDAEVARTVAIALRHRLRMLEFRVRA
jgi:hypothetical protein